MVLQFEDCIDTIQAILYGHRYDSAWYFDHSTGHDKLRPDGLNVNKMNKSFGDNVKNMRDTIDILQQRRYNTQMLFAT